MSTVRFLLSTALALAACALTVVAITATWMHRQVMETDQWTQTSVEVLRDPAVQRRAARFLADELVAQQATADGVRAALPPALRGLTGTATAALGELAERTALEALRTRALEDLWADASRTTHEQFVRWLDGLDQRRDGDVVTLDLQPAVERLARRVGIPDGVITANATATGGAEVRLVRGGQFEETRRDARRLERAARLTVPLAIVVAVLSVLVAPRRRWALVRLGAASSVAGIVVVLGTPELHAHLMSGLVEGGAARPVARAILETTTPSLVNSGWLTASGGAGLALLALLFRPRRTDPFGAGEPAPTPQTVGRRSTGSIGSPG